MDRFEQLAEQSILRGVGFAGLGIVTVMTGLAYDPARCFLSGACLAVMTATVLAFKGWHAPTRPIRDTELWIMVDGNFGMPREAAQQQVGLMLRRLYLRFAQVAFGFGAAFWAVSIGIRLFT